MSQILSLSGWVNIPGTGQPNPGPLVTVPSCRYFGDDSCCSPGIPARQCDEAEESPVVGAGAAEGDEGGRVLGQLGAAVVDQADLVLPETEEHPEIREDSHKVRSASLGTWVAFL